MILSVVIVNWNSRELIEKCLASIIRLYGDKIKNNNYEVIVIDNGSSDGSMEYLSSLSDYVRVIRNSHNAGYASASNQGMREAGGKYILLLGSDTVVKEHSLEKCIGFLESRDHCGAVGCKLLNIDGSVQNSCKRFPELKNAFYTYLSLDRFNGDYDMSWFKYDRTIEVEQIAATFLMMRSELVRRINFFDERYGILYNDVDLCQRIRDEGFSIYFLHDAVIIHHGSHSTKKAGFKLRKKMYGDIYRYYRNRFGFRAKVLYPLLLMRLLIVSSIK